jgi:glycosyltransferase involved in cell wall biosynthesis
MPLHGLLMFLGSLRLVSRLNQQVRFDCIDAHYVYPDGYAALLLGKLLRVPVVVSARGTDINLFPRFGMIRGMIRWTLQHAAGIIAVSKSLKEAMVELGALSEKICVIGNGVDTERFQPLERAAARGHLGLSEEGKAIVSVGSLIPTKGHHRVISAIAELAQVFPRLSLYILGEGPYRSQLEALVREKGLGTRVFLLGVRPNEELIYWYSAADVTCLASEREGMPNVVLESLACGTPVVATRVGGVPEAVVSPDLGVLVQSDGGDLTSGLEMALNRHWDRSVIVRQAQGRTWELVADEVERFITLSISQHPQ